jgi:glyoxylase-like metal-dependent hydrolase (beta-lactamase superfamily II)
MLKRIALSLLALVVLIGSWAWYRIGRIDVEQVGKDVWMLTGVGGNVGVLATSEGVVVVDTMTMVRQGGAILARIRELTDQPVVAILNTHYHLDHTHGNPAFKPGTKVVATARTLTHLRERDADFWRDSPARDLLPNTTFDDQHELKLGGKTIRSLHPGRGHTDGDLVVLFMEDRVVHAGDLIFNGHFPNIDLEAGGTVAGWSASMERVLALDFDKVIPGHGPLTDKGGLRRFQEFMASLWSQTKAVADRGGTVDEALREVDVERFGLRSLWFAPYLNRGFVIRRAWEEALATGRAD